MRFKLLSILLFVSVGLWGEGVPVDGPLTVEQGTHRPQRNISPDSQLPTPDSRLPTPLSLTPDPC